MPISLFDLSTSSIPAFVIETLVFGAKVYKAISEKKKAISKLKKSIPMLGKPWDIEENTPPPKEAIVPMKTLPFCLVLTPLWRENPRPIPIKVQAKRLNVKDRKCIKPS